MLIIGPGIVMTFGEKNRVLKDAGVLVENELIKAVGRFDDLKAQNPSAQVLDAGGRVILPGLVNAHMHFYSTFARGMALKDAPPENFMQVLKRLWWRLDKALGPEDCYLSAAIPILQGIRYGVTTYIDHHASPFYRDGTPLGSLEEVGQAVIDLGVRACLCYEVSDRDGETIALAGISENERWIEMCRDGHGAGRLAGVIGLHAQFTCNDSTLEAARQLNEYLRAGFHIHCAEDAADSADARTRGFGAAANASGVNDATGGAVERLASFQILGPQSILAHCIHISEKEIGMLAESGTAVVHQPTSNMNNAVGAAGIVALKRAGVLVGVGTDGMSPNVLDDYRVSSWMMRHRSGDPRQGWGESFELLTKGNPAIASRYFDHPVGVIAEGAYADIAVMDYWPPTPLDENSAAGHLLFGIAYGLAWHTVCHGKVLLKEGRLTGTLDVEALTERAREHAADLWERF